ncbi:hypothetical protein [Kitasatospora herbaricolor]|uniref:Asp23/Gls24 family envelope stress response protein n=1 Tax=Kitasatospora herbaricolor TaxID=68217 RepID=A0ABZ1WI42_9ACTN|nr:hypothetical protein [Kitasatospora herbaricolor]
MTTARAREIRRACAEAALAHPGVAALQPTLADRLTAAVSPRSAAGPPAAVRVERPPTGAGWHVEVRCILHPGRRSLDVARQVRENIHATLTAAGLLDPVEPLTVQVTITAVLRHDPGASARA